MADPLILLVALLLAYGNSFLGQFQFDDFNVIVDNDAVHGWPAQAADLIGIRPLLKLSYALSWSAGESTFPFHLFNLAVHAANTLLVYALVRVSVRSLGARIGEAKVERGAALLAALLFALHPIHTEAVTYISGRSSSLMTFFYLASVVYYAHARVRGKTWAHALSALLFACALATKETAVTLPFALLLFECCVMPAPVGLASTWRRMWARLWPHGLVLAVAGVLLASSATYRVMLRPVLRLDIVATQIHGIAYLLSRWSLLGGLSIDPDLRVQTQWTAFLMVQGVALIALVALGVWAWRRRPWLSFGIGWLFLTLAPTNTLIVRWDVANERQMYLAGIGLFMALGVELARLRAARPRAPLTAAVLALAAVLGILTWTRNGDYRDPVALWQAAARQAPNKARVYNNLGHAQRDAGDLDSARASFQRALELRPGYALARNNLRALERHAQAAVRSDPDR